MTVVALEHRMRLVGGAGKRRQLLPSGRWSGRPAPAEQRCRATISAATVASARTPGGSAVTESIPVYRYHVVRAGQPTETRWSLAPVRPSGYAGDDEPSDAHPMGNEPADVSQMQPAGRIEAPNGTAVFSTDPPVLDIPGHGQVALEAAIGVGGGRHAPELGRLVRWLPAGTA
jgi:hypothetical protein